jgi:phenylalanyl-tRNA synthetase alpha chain
MDTKSGIDASSSKEGAISGPNFIGLILTVQQDTIAAIQSSTKKPEELRFTALGPKSEFARLIKQIRHVPAADRQQVGIVVNQVKRAIEDAIANKVSSVMSQVAGAEWVDVTMPGDRPPEGHLHIVTQAIDEITDIFAKIGFTRVRHPEVDWDWYPFESLNMPPHHPARDEWETFFIEKKKQARNDKRGQMVLTPHTSNGQVREMEKGRLPIRMINIAKCYRRQSDVSHVPMFHQFEGLYIDRDVSIGDLKGVFDFFVKHFYGEKRVTRLRPFHFQFTEPSFEVDISCGVCLGKGVLPSGDVCRLCKQGWLELGGAGMVHPVVLKNGGINPDEYSGFAFGWGIERTYMMKAGTKLDDIRLLYSNDIRFLEQF